MERKKIEELTGITKYYMFYGQQSFLKMKPKMKTLSCIFFCFVLTFLVRRKKIFMEEEMRKKKIIVGETDN